MWVQGNPPSPPPPPNPLRRPHTDYVADALKQSSFAVETEAHAIFPFIYYGQNKILLKTYIFSRMPKLLVPVSPALLMNIANSTKYNNINLVHNMDSFN